MTRVLIEYICAKRFKICTITKNLESKIICSFWSWHPWHFPVLDLDLQECNHSHLQENRGCPASYYHCSNHSLPFSNGFCICNSGSR